MEYYLYDRLALQRINIYRDWRVPVILVAQT
jgi:hypothetical protein